MAEGPDPLIVARLDGEVLVYDTELSEAHALRGAGAAEFAAAPDDVSRREVLRKMALAGAAAAGGTALVKTIVAPTAAQAQSNAVCSPSCPSTHHCCAGSPNICVLNSQACCGFGGFCPAGDVCCPGTTSCGLDIGAACGGGAQCCSGCCANGQCASASACTP
jgi:hypothetical protein